MTQQRRTYSTRQLAEALGVSVQTVKRWADAGHLKVWKTMGGHRKIDAASADALIQAMRGDGADNQTRQAPKVPLHALLVDDDPAALAVLEVLVAGVFPEAHVGLAHGGFQALQSMAQKVPDLLVTDIVMPNIDGLEMLRHVTTQQNRPHLVIVTSVLAAEDVQRSGGLPAGAIFVRKPLDQEAFVALLTSQQAQLYSAAAQRSPQ